MHDKTSPKFDEAFEITVRDAALEITSGIMNYFFKEGATINEIIIVPITLLGRIIRTHDAIQLLLKEEHPSEAAVLALTQFELRLDLAYTADDVKRAAAWLEHEKLERSLLSVKKKIETLFKDEAERENLSEIFKYLSGIKHGNPVYSELGFPGRVSGGKIRISTGPIGDDFEKQFSEAVYKYALYQLAWSSQVMNVCTAKYAKVDKAVRQNVRDLYATLHPFEHEFRQFLENVAEHRPGHFGIKSIKRTKMADKI